MNNILYQTYPILKPVLLLLAAVITGTICIPYLKKIARKYKIYDHPDNDHSKRKVHSRPIPRIGGIAIFLSFIVTNLVFNRNSHFWILVLPSIPVFLLGLIDDVRSLSVKIRILIQLISAALVVYLGRLAIDNLYFTPDLAIYLPYPTGFLLSVFIIVGAINAINMVDGLDGLAGGLVLIATVLMSYTLFILNRDINFIYFFGIPVAGALLAFLKYNTYPASLFMGDGGSYWLGFIISILMLYMLKHDPLLISNNYNIPLITPVLSLAIPIIDTFFVIIIRVVSGKSPATADQSHFHHGLLKMGIPQSQVVLFIYFLSVVIAITGIMPIIFPAYISWIVSYISPFLLLTILYLVLKKEKNVSEKTALYELFIKNKNKRKELNIFFLAWERFNRYTLYFILAGTPIIAGGSQNSAIGYSAGIILFLLIILITFKMTRHDFFNVLIISVSSLLLLVANNVNSISVELFNSQYYLQEYYNWLFIIFAISILFFILLTFRRNYLMISATDFIILTMPLLLFLLPNNIIQEWNLSIIGLRSMLLFIGFRVLAGNENNFYLRIRYVVLISLLYLFLTDGLNFHILF